MNLPFISKVIIHNAVGMFTYMKVPIIIKCSFSYKWTTAHLVLYCRVFFVLMFTSEKNEMYEMFYLHLVHLFKQPKNQ